jgi:hypothetical protein
MQLCLWEEKRARKPVQTQRRVGVWHYDRGRHTASLRSWGTVVAAGALLFLLSVWSRPRYGVASSAAARMEGGTSRMAPLLAISTGILSWLAAVVIMAALLLAGLLLLNALVQRYWPPAVSLSRDSAPTVPAARAVVQRNQQQVRARAVQK